MSEELENYVEITDEDGVSTKCEIYDVIDFEDKTYALLLPLEDAENENAEVIIMEYVEEGEDEDAEGYFQSIEDEDEFNRVCNYIESLEDEEDEEE